MYWQIAAIANGVIMLAYFLISATIVRGLIKTRQLRSNRLGVATAAIFASCGAGHGYHLLHMLLPLVGIDADVGYAMRNAFDWHLVTVDVVTSGIAVWYWTLRRSYPLVLDGPVLFEDLKARQRQALEINDNVVQHLAVAKYLLGRGETDQAGELVERSLEEGKRIFGDLLDDPTPGAMRRMTSASGDGSTPGDDGS